MAHAAAPRADLAVVVATAADVDVVLAVVGKPKPQDFQPPETAATPGTPLPQR